MPRSPVSLDGLTLGLAGSGRGSGSGSGAGLGPHILACLRALVTALMFLAGTLDSSWFAVLEVLQNADYILTTCGTALPSSATLSPNTGATYGTPTKRGGTMVEGLAGGGQQITITTAIEATGGTSTSCRP